MHKTKKKTKTVKLPKPIKVKKEKSDEDRLPQSMTHYMDDRLEMIKQIFNSLKPKTIINLAPEFLKACLIFFFINFARILSNTKLSFYRPKHWKK